MSTFSLITSLLYRSHICDQATIGWISLPFTSESNNHCQRMKTLCSLTSGALYAGVVYFLILSSSIPISSGLSKHLWLVDVLPKSHNFQAPSDPSKTFSTLRSLQNTSVCWWQPWTGKHVKKIVMALHYIRCFLLLTKKNSQGQPHKVYRKVWSRHEISQVPLNY